MAESNFTERLNRAMRARDLKQVDLCALTGFSSAQVNALVTGRTADPRLATAVTLANVLDVSLDYLAGRESPEFAPGIEAQEAQTIWEAGLLATFRKLDGSGREACQAMADGLLAAQERKHSDKDGGTQ